MKVFVTSTLEIQYSEVEKVTILLNKIPGELSFIPLVSLAPEVFKHYDKKFQNPVEVQPLSFQEFFNLIDFHRDMNAGSNLSPDDFFVIITSIKNEKKWFSSFKNKDIFINALDWEKYTNNQPQFGIAHQIIENIFSSLLDIDVFNVKDNPNIHEDPIGCLNDLCTNKRRIILKIRTAYICDTCLDSFLEKQNDKKVILHIHKIITNLRDNFINYDKIKSDINPYKVIVSKSGVISFGDKILKLNALHKALYLYYLKHTEGFENNIFTKEETRKEMYNYYFIFKNTADKKGIDYICDSHASGSPYFITVKSKINTALTNFLGSEMADYFLIKKYGDINKIDERLDKNLIVIEF